MIATLRDIGESKLGTTRLCPTPGSLSQRYRSLFAIAPSHASFAIRGFHRGNAQSRHRLEEISKLLLFGFNCSLVADNVERLQGVIQTLDHDRRGFALAAARRGAMDRTLSFGGEVVVATHGLSTLAIDAAALPVDQHLLEWWKLAVRGTRSS